MIYIVRHGQTAWNLQKRKQGRKDSPLTLKGIAQAEHIAKILNKEIQDVSKFKIVVSPQWRCQQFASIVCEHIGIPFSQCIFEENLREHCFGLWEGKTEEEIEKDFPGFLARRYRPENYWSYVVPMGESYELLSLRVANVLEKYDFDSKSANLITDFSEQDFLEYLPNNILVKLDQSTMRNSQEGRVPFLDQNMIEKFLFLDEKIKYGNLLQSKFILKKFFLC